MPAARHAASGPSQPPRRAVFAVRAAAEPSVVPIRDRVDALMKFRTMKGALLVAAFLAVPPAGATVTSSVVGGELTVSSDVGDGIAIACTAGQVTVNGGAIAAACNAVTSIVVQGGDGDDVVTLVGVAAADYTTLGAVTLNGSGGNDTIVGSFRPDLIAGGPGNDTLIGDNNPAGTTDTVDGGAGDDTMVWNPGDGDDVNDGGADTDASVVNGAGADEVFAIQPNGARVRFERALPTAFFVDIGTTERLQLNAGAGNDLVSGAAGLDALIALELNGGEGNDTIVGGDGADVIHGDAGNDTLVGDDNPVAANDQSFGDAGDDTMVWSPGDDSDVNEGGDGLDVSVITGAGADETFTIGPNGTRVRFDRTLPTAFFIDIGTTERLQLFAAGGNDIVTASAGLAALVALQLNGGDGNDTIVGSDGADTIHGDAGNDAIFADDNPAGTTDLAFGDAGDDTIVWNPGDDDDVNEGGDGNDTSVITGGGASETFTVNPVAGRVRLDRTNPAPFFVDIGTTETLRVDAGDGDDVVTGTIGLAGLVALELNGGAGNDTLTGGDSADLLRGGPGNDTLIGDNNPAATTDRVFGDDGDDTMTWNPGDGDDTNDGGAGLDTTLVNGAGAAERFAIAEQAGRVHFQRTTPTPFFVDIGGDVETLAVNAGAGADTIATQPLLATTQVLDGGDPSTIPGDRLSVQGFAEAPASPIVVPGFAPITHVGFEAVPSGGTVSGRTFVDVDRDGVADATDGPLAGITVFADLDNDRVLDAGETATLSAADGSYTLTFGADSTGERVRAVLPTGALHTGTDPQPLDVFGGSTTNGVDFGFVTPAPGTTGLTAALAGAQEVPPVTTNATGRGTVVFDAARTQMTVRLSFSGLAANATLAHIHGPAAAGAEAAPIFDLPLGAATTSGEIGPLTFAVTPQQAADALAGLWYFNVHSAAAPDGEIRGQVLVDRVIEAFLDGTQETPPTITPARGFGTVTVAGPGDRMLVTLRYAGLVGEGAIGASTLVQIHGPAARGVATLPTFDLRVSGSDNDAFATGEIAILAEEAVQLDAGLFYFNVHSSEFPQGEIRGQIDDVQFTDGFE